MTGQIEFIRPLRFGRLTRLLRIRRVDVSLHWSVLLISVVILMGAVRRPFLSLVGLISYLSVLLIHECGHLILAQRLRCQVFAIEIYPIFAITRFEIPRSQFDHCVIAWGGVLAQLIVAVPLIAWVTVFGFTPFGVVNAAMAILGYFSLGIALWNLLPFAPLDGAIAWEIIPALFQRKPQPPTRPRNDRGSWR